MENPGLQVLSMEGKRKDCEGKIQVRITPSPKFPLGIFINVNQHYDLPEPEKQSEMTPVDRNNAFLSTLGNEWDEFSAFAKITREHLLKSGLPPKAKSKKKRKN